MAAQLDHFCPQPSREVLWPTARPCCSPRVEKSLEGEEEEEWFFACCRTHQASLSSQEEWIYESLSAASSFLYEWQFVPTEEVSLSDSSLAQLAIVSYYPPRRLFVVCLLVGCSYLAALGRKLISFLPDGRTHGKRPANLLSQLYYSQLSSGRNINLYFITMIRVVHFLFYGGR